MSQPYFAKPSTAPFDTEYDLNSKPPHEVLRMRMPSLTWRPITLVTTNPSVEMISGNELVIPVKGMKLGKHNKTTNTMPVRLYGRMAGQSGIQAIIVVGTPVNNTQPVEVTVKLKRQFRINLDGPHMALNSHDTPVPYAMDRTETVPSTMTPAELIDMVKAEAEARKKEHGTSVGLKHLVFSCHGFPGQILIFGKNDTDLFDDSNVHLFSRLKGLVGVIWVLSCAVAGGTSFCESLASNAGCYLVAASMTVPTTGLSLAGGQIDMDLGCLPTIFPPAGDKQSINTFAMNGPDLGFELEPA